MGSDQLGDSETRILCSRMAETGSHKKFKKLSHRPREMTQQLRALDAFAEDQSSWNLL